MTIPDRSTLASSTARRQSAHLGWSLTGVLTLVLSYAMATMLQRYGLATHQFAQTVLWCALPYALAAHWNYSGAGLPAAERSSLLVITTVTPFLLLMLGFALTQQAYSRGAVLMVYVLSTAWFALGTWWHRRNHAQRLAYLDEAIPEQLQALCGHQAFEGREIELMPWPRNDLLPERLPAVDAVVLDQHVPSNTARSHLLSRLKLNHVRIYSVETVAELLSGRKSLPTQQDDLWQIDGNPAYDVAKRSIDVLLVMLTIPLWLPLSLLVAMAVKIDSTGPALFSQNRVGRDGHVFRLWKFRSMRHQDHPQPARFAQQMDDRITRVGRVIRRWRLDELPQLFNVLLGHMSLIGPRPEQSAFVESFAARIPAYPYRHLVRPGLTGWAQVHQGYAEGEEQTVVKLSYDLYYVAHYCTALDLLIAFQTIRIILTGFGSR